MSHECFADEIAIDFPSVGRAVERICDDSSASGWKAKAETCSTRKSAVAAGSQRRPGHLGRSAGARHVPELRRPRGNLD
jgi:hypothetical protein